MAPWTENVPVCRCSISFTSGRLSSSHTPAEFLSPSCTRISDTTRLEVFPRGHPTPHPLCFLLLFGDMHYAMLHILKKVLSRFSFAFYIYHQCLACRYDCSDKICAMYDAYFDYPILYVRYSLFLFLFLSVSLFFF